MMLREIAIIIIQEYNRQSVNCCLLRIICNYLLANYNIFVRHYKLHRSVINQSNSCN